MSKETGYYPFYHDFLFGAKEYHEEAIAILKENPPFPPSSLVRVFSDVDHEISQGIGRVIENIWSVDREQHLNEILMESGLVWRVLSERLERVVMGEKTMRVVLRNVK